MYKRLFTNTTTTTITTTSSNEASVREVRKKDCELKVLQLIRWKWWGTRDTPGNLWRWRIAADSARRWRPNHIWALDCLVSAAPRCIPVCRQCSRRSTPAPGRYAYICDRLAASICHQPNTTTPSQSTLLARTPPLHTIIVIYFAQNSNINRTWKCARALSRTHGRWRADFKRKRSIRLQ